MLGKSGKNSHSSTVIVDGNSAQISFVPVRKQQSLSSSHVFAQKRCEK